MSDLQPLSDTKTGRERSIANLRPIKPGETRNPGGKPKGSRNRLQGDFTRRLADDFERFGIYAIARCRRYEPAQYLRVIASLMPKELEIKKPLDEIPDEQLDAAVIAVRAIFAAQHSGTDASGASQAQHPSSLQALPETT